MFSMYFRIMEDSPELVKLLKYIIFGTVLVLQVPSVSSLLSQSPHQPHPFNGEDFSRFRSSDLISSSENRGGSDSSHEHGLYKRGGDAMSPEGGMRPVLEKFGGSLCSIFKTFLEPRRRFQRCRVGGPGPNMRRGVRRERGRRVERPLTPLGSNDLQEGDMLQLQQRHDMEMRMMAMGMAMENERMSQGSGMMSELDEEQINTSGEDGRPMDHDGRRGGGEEQDENIDPTKVSQDRTMILVPERSCPPGSRRDARGYCRRLVKIRTNYQYGPPPLPARMGQNGGGAGVVRPIPIRYYYSRIVTIPAFQFFYPSVRV